MRSSYRRPCSKRRLGQSDIKRRSVDKADRKLIAELLPVLLLLFPEGIDKSRVQSTRQFFAIKILLIGIEIGIFGHTATL